MIINKLARILILTTLIIQCIGASERTRLIYNRLTEGTINRSTTEYLEIDLKNSIPKENENEFEMLLIHLESPKIIRDNLVGLQISQGTPKSEYFDLKKANLHFDESHILVPLKKGFLYLVDLSLGPEIEKTGYKMQLYSPDV